MAAIGSLIQAGGNGATFPVVHHGGSAAPRVSCRVEGCLGTFKNQQAINFHLHSHTEEERAALFPVSPRPATPSGPFHCGSPGCKIQPGGKTLKTFASATSHVIREHASKTLRCTVPDCGALFVLRRDLKKHTKSKHGVGCKWPVRADAEEQVVAQAPRQDGEQDQVRPRHPTGVSARVVAATAALRFCRTKHPKSALTRVPTQAA